MSSFFLYLSKNVFSTDEEDLIVGILALTVSCQQVFTYTYFITDNGQVTLQAKNMDFEESPENLKMSFFKTNILPYFKPEGLSFPKSLFFLS